MYMYAPSQPSSENSPSQDTHDGSVVQKMFQSDTCLDRDAESCLLGLHIDPYKASRIRDSRVHVCKGANPWSVNMAAGFWSSSFHVPTPKGVNTVENTIEEGSHVLMENCDFSSSTVLVP